MIINKYYLIIIIVILQGSMFRMKGMEVELANGKDTSSLFVGRIMHTLLILKLSC